MKGRFITFEGSEGSGKSTQASLAYQYLQEQKKPVLFIREPGGTKISEAIRRILLDVRNEAMTDECETLLYMAARSQVVDEIVVPALKKGTIVLCDRFLDSTLVYQGYGNGVDRKVIKEIGRFATKGVTPDLTLLFDIETVLQDDLDRGVVPAELRLAFSDMEIILSDDAFVQNHGDEWQIIDVYEDQKYTVKRETNAYSVYSRFARNARFIDSVCWSKQDESNLLFVGSLDFFGRDENKDILRMKIELR